MRVTHPVHIDDHHVGGAGLVLDPGGDRLDRHRAGRRDVLNAVGTSGTPATVCAIAAERSSYWRSSWARSSCANKTNPTTTVAVRIASWAAKIWLDSLRFRDHAMS